MKPLLISIFLLFISLSETVFSQNPEIEKNITPSGISSNGKFIFGHDTPPGKKESENGLYSCTFRIAEVGDEVRRLCDFIFFENGRELYRLNKVPGSDITITNQGFALFFDHSRHFAGELAITACDKSGILKFRQKYKGASLFNFSDYGTKMGVNSPAGLSVISLDEGKSVNFPASECFSFSSGGEMMAAVHGNKIALYSGSRKITEFESRLDNIRRVACSDRLNMVAAINRNELKVYSAQTGRLLSSARLGKDSLYRDLRISGSTILTGIHKKGKGESRGIMRSLNVENWQSKEITTSVRKINQPQSSVPESMKEGRICWPFAPFDSMRTVWNHYEQNMDYYPETYLHQGLDMIVPTAEPVYSVSKGIVKCVLTLGGDIYWRIAVSKEQNPGYSNGWLYAHLIESTIQFDQGDTVKLHDYLGDIIHWSGNWGHIHFVEIRDTGLVWSYDDNEWGINYNPLLVLDPLKDKIVPEIQEVFPGSRFGFCVNETSNYLKADSLYGEIDIIVKVNDYIGNSPWSQPAYKTYYTIKAIQSGAVIVPRRLGHILNHTYEFYAVDNYFPYAPVLYKTDSLLEASSWMDLERDYYHIITNDDGDSILTLEEKQRAFNTALYPDGEYRIIVEAYDPSGNRAIDSMDVMFKNKLSGAAEEKINVIREYTLEQNYPNPFNPSTIIRYSLPRSSDVELKVFDILGRETALLVNKWQAPGSYEVAFNAGELSCGIYYYRLKAGNFIETRKMLLLK